MSIKPPFIKRCNGAAVYYEKQVILLFNDSRRVKWTKLDNAAKIFPCTTTARDPKVFRTACELYSEIEPEILQQALDKAIEHFPCFKCVLKKGVFWYYFEQADIRPIAHEENKSPCSAIYSGDSRTLLFDVSWFGKRINLEVYHALTDGTGAMNFLRAIVFYYLTRKYAGDFKNGLPQFDYGASYAQKADDSFFKYYSKEKKTKKPKNFTAYKIRGDRLDTDNINIIEGIVSTSALLNAARERGVTITAMLAAIMICSIHEGMALRDEGKSVGLVIPVNLRNHFKSESARNFFAAVKIQYNFKKSGSDFQSVLQSVASSLKEKLDDGYLRRHMNEYSKIENNIAAKIVPVILKDPCMSAATKVFEKGETAAFSNVGKVQMPPELEKYIRLFDVFVSTSKVQICACSFNDNFVISFTSAFSDCDIQRCFFTQLSSMGIDVELSANLIDKE